MNKEQPFDNLKGSEIAVVGMAGRFPGARNVDIFWQNLRDGIEAITFFSDEELRSAGVEEATLHSPNYVKSGMVLDEMEMFDAGFFGFSPRDAAIMDPQHRHFLEVSWEALEHAGYDPERFEGAIGVFGGSGGNFYMPYNLLTNPDLMKSLGLFMVRHTGNDKDFLTTRVSYLFNLRGPSINVQTACSTSLVAIHLACQSLMQFECDMALAGGVTIEMPHRHGYFYQEGEILSPDGHCRAFDADSKGTVFGSGVGVVVLRRLEDALKDHDTIHAIILGSAINNDGAGKMNYFAPSVDGQAAAIVEALSMADVSADDISYIETHGTGTPIGDPIEITALTQAFRATSRRNGYCGIGSVKTNIGHLDTAAGVASLIKVIQALKHRQLPPSLNFQKPNPAIDFEHTPFYVQAKFQEWHTENGPRRAGVSSLGVGGTNAHIVVEEAPFLKDSPPSAHPWHLLVLSAKSPTALDQATQRLATYLEEHTEIDLADVAYTLQLGRRAFAYRRVLACHDRSDAITALRNAESKRLISGQTKDGTAQVVYMFPGGGAQYVNMGRELYQQEPIYKDVVDKCLALIQPHLPFDLKSLMYPASADIDAAAAALEKPLAGLVALFITEYATARLWMAWGILPTAMTGHSMGEYTAACLAGVMSLSDALAIVALRGRLFESLPEGGMLSIPLSEAEIAPLLVEGASVSVINSPTTCVVSGNIQAIAAMEEMLLSRGVECRRVKITVAAHSPMLDGILDEFHQHLAQLPLKRATLPFLSNLSGTWADPDEVATPHYWVNHLRHTVRFSDGIATLMESGNYLLLEVGPGNTLGSLARQHPNRPTTLASMRHPRESVPDMPFALSTLGRLWIAAQPVDWKLLHAGEKHQRVPLPTYPFEHQRYWIDPGKQTFSVETKQATLTRMPNLDDWFYQPVWRRANIELPTESQNPQRWLIFADTVGLGAAIGRLLEKAGHEVITVAEGREYTKSGKHSYVLNPRLREHYFDLIEDLQANGGLPQQIVHLWAVTPPAAIRSHITFYETTRDRVFYSLLFMTQALSKENRPHPISISVISNGMQQVADEGLPYPEKAILLGPCKVIPREYSDITCRSIDITVPTLTLTERLLSKPADSIDQLAQQIIVESGTKAKERVIAYRGADRWVEEYKSAVPTSARNRLRERGIYLITGGLGGIGLTLAQSLAQSGQPQLALLSRTQFPEREEWDRLLAIPGADPQIAHQVRAIRKMEAAGAEVMVIAANVDDREQLERAIGQVKSRFGAPHGVIHAAGTIDDALIQSKSAGAAERILSPKVRGTLLLDELLRNEPLDFLILFSSTSTILGPAGQIDYVAANAFLNAYAQSKRHNKAHPYTLAVNWGMWQDVGMAVKADTKIKSSTESKSVSDSDHTLSPAAHPLLQHYLSKTDKEIIYLASYSPQKEWVLDQHRLIGGQALMPGTGFLELARAAMQNANSTHPTGADDRANGHQPQLLEIENLSFLSPLHIEENALREVRVALHKNGSGYEFQVSSRVMPNAEWQEHASAHLRYTSQIPMAHRVAIEDITARCTVHRQSFGVGEQFTQQEHHLSFGKRWKVLREVYYGKGEALALLELPEQYSSDLETYDLHPALLDLATGYGLPLVNSYEVASGHMPDLYVPLSYAQVTVHRSLTRKLYSHARYRGRGIEEKTLSTTQSDIVSFDIDILDEYGNLLVSVHNFTMKRLRNPQQFLATLNAQNQYHSPSPQPLLQANAHESSKPTLLSIGLREGIRPTEGVEVFQRLLKADYAPQAIATSLNLDALVEFVTAAEVTAKAGPQFARPQLASEYLAPRDDLEKGLVTLWEETLGIQQIGVQDDFFDLGGESLIAIRLLTQMRRKFSIDLPMSTFFQAPTIAQQAEQLRTELDQVTSANGPKRQTRIRRLSSLVPIQPNGDKLPLFFVHGGFGNVMIFSVLSDYLGLDQPFFGLQAQGVDGKSKPLTRIEDMAALYVREIREVRPHGPYLVAGFSMGGEVAYEMAQQLTAAGEEVRLLLLMDTWNPDRAVRRQKPSTIQQGGNNLHAAQNLKPITQILGKLWKPWTRQRIYYLRQRIQKKAYRIGLNAAVRIVQAQSKTLPFSLVEKQIWELNEIAVATYVPRPYPGKIVLFRASDSLEWNPIDSPMSWAKLAQGGLEQHIIEGNHQLVSEPYVRDVVKQLRNILEEAENGEIARKTMNQ